MRKISLRLLDEQVRLSLCKQELVGIVPVVHLGPLVNTRDIPLPAVDVAAKIRFFGQGDEEANLTELSNIQAAMDAMLAQNGLRTVEALPSPGTNDFSALPTGGILPPPEPLYPAFLRFGNAANPTKCFYTWDTSGKLEQSSCS